MNCQLQPEAFQFEKEKIYTDIPYALQLLDLSYNPELGGQGISRFLNFISPPEATFGSNKSLVLLGLSYCGIRNNEIIHDINLKPYRKTLMALSLNGNLLDFFTFKTLHLQFCI